MKRGLYCRLAFQGLQKNRKLTVPFLLSASMMVMMYAVMCHLQGSPALQRMLGAPVLESILSLGTWVIVAFAVLFLLYAHSFLLKRRTTEFGLYHVLGLERKHIACVLAWETAILWFLSLLCGLALSAAFSKLFEMILIRILGGTAGYELSLNPMDFLKTAALFSVLFLILFFRAWLSLSKVSALSLLRSSKVGEKPPKANWLLALLGIVILALAYGIAISIDQPVVALTVFFVAVLLVIIATYLLFLAGSVALCKMLKNNSKFYYHPVHFVSVSSMAYRMKRTGAGLASICILSTMVLVMLSSTSSLYFGIDNALRMRYPYDPMISGSVYETSEMDDAHLEPYELIARELPVTNLVKYRHGDLSGYFEDSSIVLDTDDMEALSLMHTGRIGTLQIIPLSDYCALTGKSITLEKDECLLYSNLFKHNPDSFSIGDIVTFRVKEGFEVFPRMMSESMVSVMAYAFLVTDAFDETVSLLQPITVNGQYQAVTLRWEIGFDTQGSRADKLTYEEVLSQRLKDIGVTSVGREGNRNTFMILTGSLLFLGCVLSFIFLLSESVIMYYKQISEGFEDAGRFEIMQKVGMTEKEIKKSVSSQMLTVFFAPLGMAGLHLCFAMPLTIKLLRLFALNDTAFTLWVTAGCYALFALVYVLVYRCTANVYTSIVTGKNKEE